MTLLSALLTSCASGFSAPKASPPLSLAIAPQLYQPRVLRLRAQQEIATLDGVHRPKTDEVWHSDAAYRQLEQENINLAAALAQLRARERRLDP